MDAVTEYALLTAALVDGGEIVAGNLFGKPCIKAYGKACVAQHLDRLVFKLDGDAHKRAMAVSGAELWDPSGKGRPMKAWVALPAAARKHFRPLADAALALAMAEA